MLKSVLYSKVTSKFDGEWQEKIINNIDEFTIPQIQATLESVKWTKCPLFNWKIKVNSVKGWKLEKFSSKNGGTKTTISIFSMKNQNQTRIQQNIAQNF